MAAMTLEKMMKISYNEVFIVRADICDVDQILIFTFFFIF